VRPLTEPCRVAIERYLSHAVNLLQMGQDVQALGFLQDARKTWNAGKQQ
jgi:hypothetical protein